MPSGARRQVSGVSGHDGHRRATHARRRVLCRARDSRSGRLRHRRRLRPKPPERPSPRGSIVYGDAADTRRLQQHRQHRAALFPYQNYRRDAYHVTAIGGPHDLPAGGERPWHQPIYERGGHGSPEGSRAEAPPHCPRAHRRIGYAAHDDLAAPVRRRTPLPALPTLAPRHAPAHGRDRLHARDALLDVQGSQLLRRTTRHRQPTSDTTARLVDRPGHRIALAVFAGRPVRQGMTCHNPSSSPVVLAVLAGDVGGQGMTCQHLGLQPRRDPVRG